MCVAKEEGGLVTKFLCRDKTKYPVYLHIECYLTCSYDERSFYYLSRIVKEN